MEEHAITSATHKCLQPGCGMIFTTKSLLERHSRVHTGEKPYICEICLKQFSQFGNLTKHKRSHDFVHLRYNRLTDAKPFRCDVVGCNRSFTAKSSLQSHKLRHEKNTVTVSTIITSEQEVLENIVQSTLEVIPVANSLQSLDSVASQQPNILKDDCATNGCNTNLLSESHDPSQCPCSTAVYNHLRQSVIAFASIIKQWDSKSDFEKDSALDYVDSILTSVLASPTGNAAASSASNHQISSDLMYILNEDLFSYSGVLEAPHTVSEHSVVNCGSAAVHASEHQHNQSCVPIVPVLMDVLEELRDDHSHHHKDHHGASTDTDPSGDGSKCKSSCAAQQLPQPQDSLCFELNDDCECIFDDDDSAPIKAATMTSRGISMVAPVAAKKTGKITSRRTSRVANLPPTENNQKRKRR